MIIIFNGPPGTGKDEACLFFTQKGFTHLSFKHELYKETVKYFGVSMDWFMNGYIDRSVKEQKEETLGGRSRREAMIYVSEEVIKPKFGSDYFGLQAATKIKKGRDYCFSDGGFVDEIMSVINTSEAERCIIVQLTRDGCDFSSDSRRYIDGNLAEQFIIRRSTEISKLHVLPHKFPVCMYRIHNNGSIEEFYDALEKIYEKEKNVKEDADNKEASDIS